MRSRARKSANESPKTPAPAPPVVPSSEVAEYLEHLRSERDVSPNTILAYARDLSELVFFFSTYYGGDGWSWQGVDRLAIRGFLAHLLAAASIIPLPPIRRAGHQAIHSLRGPAF